MQNGERAPARRQVAIVAFHHAGKVLLQDRRSISKFGEDWGWFGGKIEVGETPDQALVREIKEELGYDLGEHPGGFRLFRTYEVDVPVRVCAYFYLCEVSSTEGFHQHEGDGMVFFTIDEALALKMVPGDKIILRDLKGVLAHGG
jgi:8-oxo-dGTP diphosphatase